MTRILALALMVALAACARKNPPEPPADAIRSGAPELVAPDVVTDPIRASID